MPKISVVIPAYNEEKYLGATLDSLVNQNFPKSDYEIIVVDNASTDGTVKIARKYPVRVISEPRLSVVRAFQTGFSAAISPIIASAGADTIYPPDWITSICSHFSSPDTVGVYGPVVFLETDHLPTRIFSFISPYFFRLNHFLGTDMPSGANMAVRKNAFLQIGGFDLRLTTAEDTYLYYRLKKLGRFIYLPTVIAKTSNRRLVHEKSRFFAHHAANLLRFKFSGSSSSNFTPYR